MNHFFFKRLSGLALAVAFALAGPSVLSALTIQFDYTYDTAHFFDNGNESRRDLLAAAASVFTSRITDSLDAITPSGGDSWNAQTFDPANPSSTLSLGNVGLAANTIVVYVGATNLGSTLGLGGPGGFGSTGSAAWNNLVASRGQAGALATTPTDFGPWGGTLTFNNTSTWYFDSNPATLETFAGQNDFYSVAVHELGHLLGSGTADSWNALISGNNFTGSHAAALQGGNVALDPGLGHWLEGTMSTIAGTAIAQEAAMDPSLTVGDRKYFTALDYAGLEDVGWALSPIPEPATYAWVAGLGALVVAVRRRTPRS